MVYRSFEGVSDVRDATLEAILDQAGDDVEPADLVSAAAAYQIVLTPEDAATRIVLHMARRGQREEYR